MPPYPNQPNPGEVLRPAVSGQEVASVPGVEPEIPPTQEIPSSGAVIPPVEVPQPNQISKEAVPNQRGETPAISPEANRVEEKAADRVVEGVMPGYAGIKQRVMANQAEAFDVSTEFDRMDQKDLEALGIKEDPNI